MPQLVTSPNRCLDCGRLAREGGRRCRRCEESLSKALQQVRESLAAKAAAGAELKAALMARRNAAPQRSASKLNRGSIGRTTPYRSNQVNERSRTEPMAGLKVLQLITKYAGVKPGTRGSRYPAMTESQAFEAVERLRDGNTYTYRSGVRTMTITPKGISRRATVRGARSPVVLNPRPASPSGRRSGANSSIRKPGR